MFVFFFALFCECILNDFSIVEYFIDFPKFSEGDSVDFLCSQKVFQLLSVSCFVVWESFQGDSGPSGASELY